MSFPSMFSRTPQIAEFPGADPAAVGAQVAVHPAAVEGPPEPRLDGHQPAFFSSGKNFTADGQSFRTAHRGQRGFLALQVCRPWSTSRELKSSQSRRGTSCSRSFSIFSGNGLPAQPQPSREPADVGVDRDALGLPESRREHDIGRLAGDAGQGQKLLHGRRDLTPEILLDPLRRADDALGLVAEKAAGADFRLQGGPVGVGEVRGGRILTEETGRDHVHPLVGALRGKDGGDEDLEGRLINQGRPAVRMLPAQDPDDLADAFLGRFHVHPFSGRGHERIGDTYRFPEKSEHVPTGCPDRTVADVEEVLAEVEILDVIIIGEAAEEVDLRPDHEKVAPLDPAQVFEDLAAPGIGHLRPGLAVIFLGGLLRLERHLEQVEDRARLVNLRGRLGPGAPAGNRELRARITLLMQALEDQPVLGLFEDQELELLLEKDVFHPAQDPPVKTDGVDLGADRDRQDLGRLQPRVYRHSGLPLPAPPRSWETATRVQRAGGALLD